MIFVKLTTHKGPAWVNLDHIITVTQADRHADQEEVEVWTTSGGIILVPGLLDDVMELIRTAVDQ